MRIIPVSLRFAAAPTKEALDRVQRASAITHRHPRSQLACGFFTLLIRELLQGRVPQDAYAEAISQFRAFYESDNSLSAEFEFLQLLLAEDLANRPESEVSSSGYVVHTLTASIWSLLTTRSFEECVLNAVNLGGDTDTTGCVAGGLAGVHYGLTAIRSDWITILARSEEIGDLFQRFTDLCRE